MDTLQIALVVIANVVLVFALGPWFARRRGRAVAGVLLLLVAVGTQGFAYLARPRPNLTVASWGDAYGRAQMVGMFHPYTDATGVDVDATIHGGGLDDIRRQVASGRVEWDVVDMELADAQAACREGLLERISDLELHAGANGARAEADFVPGALGPCWIGTSVYSQIVAYDAARLPAAPKTLADFFDLARFPGARALRDAGPMWNLELALMADGVGVQNVYPLLRTRRGVDRAFAKLDSIKPALAWWKRTNEPVELIARGAVVMATALNGRVFEAVMADRDVGGFWDGQLYQMDVFALPKGGPNVRRARDFLVDVTGAQPLAEQARWLPFGPARRSAAALVGTHPERGIPMRRYHPTAPENFRNALAVNPEWWALNGAEIEERWRAWRASE